MKMNLISKYNKKKLKYLLTVINLIFKKAGYNVR